MATHVELAAAEVTVEEANGALVIGFIEQDSGTEHYVMLQRALDPDTQDVELGHDAYYVEVNDQSCSSYRGIERFALSRHGASLLFGARSDGLRGLRSADIRFQIGDREFEHLHNQLLKVFSGTSVYERVDV